MQTSTTFSSLNRVISIITVIYIATFSNVTMANDENQIALASLETADQWQINRLFEPTKKQAQKELSGKVMIYDGLRDSTIKKALDNNFKRIQNMMFTRVVVTNISGQPATDEFGNVEAEDDGCD